MSVFVNTYTIAAISSATGDAFRQVSESSGHILKEETTDRRTKKRLQLLYKEAKQHPTRDTSVIYLTGMRNNRGSTGNGTNFNSDKDLFTEGLLSKGGESI